MSNKFSIKCEEPGIQMFSCMIIWTDKDNVQRTLATDDPEVAETTIGLLTGNINLTDLEP